jgi:hypothetical protein
MGVELFGAGRIVLIAVGCIGGYVVAGERIYGAQRIDTRDGAPQSSGIVLTVSHHARERRSRLPAPAPLPAAGDEASG